MRRELGLYPYRVQLAQTLHRGDEARRWEFTRWLVQQCADDNGFFDKLLMSDEAKFHLDGTVSKHNCRIWATEQPAVFQTASTFSPSLTVWCAMTAGGVARPYFFESSSGEPLTVTAQRYQNMLQQFFLPWLRRHHYELSTLWFQQDGATAHTAASSLRFLQGKFPSRVISKQGSVNWPPRSPDLSALDFFLWGYLKNEVYKEPVATLTALKARIRHCIRALPQTTLQATMRDSLMAHVWSVCAGTEGTSKTCCFVLDRTVAGSVFLMYISSSQLELWGIVRLQNSLGCATHIFAKRL